MKHIILTTAFFLMIVLSNTSSAQSDDVAVNLIYTDAFVIADLSSLSEY